MKSYLLSILLGLVGTAAIWSISQGGTSQMEGTVKLPEPVLKGKVSVEEAITARRSQRSFSSEALTIQQVSQILWCAQGKCQMGFG